MRRGENIFELNVNAHDIVERGVELEGSNLSGVSARCSWVEQSDWTASGRKSRSELIENNLSPNDEDFQRNSNQLKSPASFRNQETTQCGISFRLEDLHYSNASLPEATELGHLKRLEGVLLVFNLEAGSLLPLAIR